MELKNISGTVVFALESATTIAELVTAARRASANLSSADLSYAKLSYADLSSACLSSAKLSYAKLKGALIDGKPIINLRQISYSGYAYGVQAVLFEDGSRWVRMGCLWKSLAEWEEIGIRSSNPSEFPDDGSVASEERVAAFEFAKAAALRM